MREFEILNSKKVMPPLLALAFVFVNFCCAIAFLHVDSKICLHSASLQNKFTSKNILLKGQETSRHTKFKPN